jgi:hypothetical protein
MNDWQWINSELFHPHIHEHTHGTRTKARKGWSYLVIYIIDTSITDITRKRPNEREGLKKQGRKKKKGYIWGREKRKKG